MRFVSIAATVVRAKRALSESDATVSALRRVSCRVCVAGPTRISQSFSHALTAVHFRRTLGVRCAAQEQLSALTQFGHGMPPWSIIYTHNFTVPVQHDGARHHSFGR